MECNCGILEFDKCDQVVALKKKVICDYKDMLLSIQKGHIVDYSRIMNEIALVEIAEKGWLPKCDFYINFYLGTKWEIAERF
jgi:hypothetical protein|nr:MAG TPA: hypothetical protein [Caudoviricetes sp.]